MGNRNNDNKKRVTSKNKLQKEGVNMAALTERMFVIREDKTAQFFEVLKKPMISTQFLENCRKSAKTIRETKKK